MNYLDTVRKYGGGIFYDRKTAKVNVENTAYGALIERFEDDKFDIQLTVVGLDNLDKVLNLLTNKKIQI